MTIDLRRLFAAITGRIDGGVLVREALAADASLGEPGWHILAVGKVAFPMLRGLLEATGGTAGPASGLVISPEHLFPGASSLIPRPIADRLDAALPPRVGAIAADHPEPTARSVAAARAARSFVGRLSARDRLMVLLSGGTSSLLAAPAGDIGLDDKRLVAAALARAGANIHELNAVRKHLSAVKGGRLGLATAARTVVLALSDVVGNDPATIGSGPFSPDPTTFSDALAVVERLAPEAPPRVLARLALGASGQLEETPKPGDPQLDHVVVRVIAGPGRAAEEARRAAETAGLKAGLLARETELDVEELARSYVERARHEAGAGGVPRVLVGNGEPTIRVAPGGRGGRALHLALLVGRGISGLAGVTFLAAGTDDRDGSSDASGALVDGNTSPAALDSGLEPEAALRACNTEAVLAALGCLVRGPGTSNLLDVHLLAIERS